MFLHTLRSSAKKGFRTGVSLLESKKALRLPISRNLCIRVWNHQSQAVCRTLPSAYFSTKPNQVSQNDDSALSEAQQLSTEASAVATRGDFNGALEIFKKALKLRQDFYGGQDANAMLVARSFSDIGSVYFEMDNLDTALEYYDKALAMQQALIANSDHPDMGTTLKYRGEILFAMQRYDDCLENFRETLAVWDTVYGDAPFHDKAVLYMNMGAVYLTMSDLHSSLTSYLSGLAVLKKVEGKVLNPTDNLCQVYAAIGGIYAQLTDDDNALVYHTLAFNTLEKMYGKDGSSHRKELSASLYDIGVASHNKGLYEQAHQSYTRALKYARQHWQSDLHPSIASILGNMGHTYREQGDDEGALNCFQQALDIMLDPQYIQWNRAHDDQAYINGTVVNELDTLIGTYMSCALVHLDLQQTELALQSLEGAKTAAITALGEKHATVLRIARMIDQVLHPPASPVMEQDPKMPTDSP